MACLRNPFVACAAVAAALLLACSSPEERFADHVRRGDEFADAGKMEEAILEYRSALRIVPDDPGANERIAAQLVRRGDPSGTVYLEEAIRLAPERDDLKARLARLLLTMDRRDDAERLLRESLAAHPKSADLRAAQSELLLYQADTAGAVAAAEQATALDPESETAWIQLGRAQVGRVREALIEREQPPDAWYDAAVSAFERADELAGGLVPARIEKAQVLGMRDATRERAAEAFTAAVELAGEQGDAAVEMAAASTAAAFGASNGQGELQRWALRRMIALDEDQFALWKQLADASTDAEGGPLAVYQELIERRPDEPEAHMLYAAYLVDSGDERAAMRHMRKVIAESPDAPRAWEQLIRLQLSLKRYAKARATFVRMNDEFPDSPITRRAEARIALAELRNGDAVKILRALGARSREFETQRMLAIAEYRDGNLPNAAAAIERALALEDDFAPEAMRLKAKIHHDSGEWADTLRVLAELSRHGEPISQRELVMRARALYELGRPAAGRRVLMEVLRRPRPIAWAAVEFADREGDENTYQAAVYLKRALAEQPWNPDVVEKVVEIELSQGRPAQALGYLDAALETGFARPETLLLRAYVLTKLNELERAEADALRAFEANPELEGAADLIYAIYRAQGRLDEARQSFEEAARAGVLHPGAHLLLGRIYLAQGRDRKARRTFEDILRKHPELTAAKNDLAFLLADQNEDLDRALELAEEAQQSMSTDPNAADTVGYVYYRRGLHEAALQQFQYALELNRNRRNNLDPTLHYHLGLTLDALERGDEAAAAYRRALELDANFPHAEDARRRIEAMGQASPTAPQPS